MKKFISASINLNTSNHMNIGEVKQLDDVELDLSIYSNGVAAPLDGQIISLFVRRANNTIVQQVEGITPTGSKLKIKCKNSCFAVKGSAELELRLVDSTGGMSTSFFYVEVKESIGCSEDIEISKNEYEILDKVNKDEVIRQSNEETRKNNENTRQSNEAKRQVKYEEIKGISSDIFKSSGSETKLVTPTDWVNNTDSNSSAKYMYDIVHALKSTDVILDIYSSTSNMTMLKNCRVISDSIVRLFSNEKIGVKAVLIACYNIQGKQAYDEVVAARGSYSTIGKRFDSVDAKVGEISVGGRNLILNTSFDNFTDYKYWGITRATANVLRKGEIHVSYNSGNSSNPTIWSKKTSSKIIKGETYTLSFYAKAQGSNTNKAIEVFMDDGYPRTFISAVTVTTDYKKYTLTFVLDKDITNVNNIQFMFYLKINNLAIGNAEMWIKDIKLERGTIATDWKSAIEDKNVIEVMRQVTEADKTIKATFQMDVGAYLVSATYDDNPLGSGLYRNNSLFILENFVAWDGSKIVNRLKITNLIPNDTWGASWVNSGTGDKYVGYDPTNTVYIYKILTSIDMASTLDQWELNIIKLNSL